MDRLLEVRRLLGGRCCASRPLVLLAAALLPARADEAPAPLHLFLQINLTSVLSFFPGERRTADTGGDTASCQPKLSLSQNRDNQVADVFALCLVYSEPMYTIILETRLGGVAACATSIVASREGGNRFAWTWF
jgi:hypothetical protein